MPTIAQGIRKQTTIGKQTALGVPKTGAGGQILRRKTSVFALTKASYESDEIVTHQQSTGSRGGVRATTGKINGLLSPGTYKLLLASSMRKDFVAITPGAASITVTAAAAAPQFVRTTGSFLTDGLKVGDVIQWTGWTTTGATNNSRQFWITALTALNMTGKFLDGTTVTAKAAGDSVTATVQGKKTYAPMTGHTDDIFTFEEWYPDIVQSELFPDSKLDNVAIGLPASGNATVDFDFKGLDRTLAAVQSFTAPAAETTTEILTGVQGLLMVSGATVANVTGLNFTINEGVTPDGPVVGSNISPDLSRGKIKINGQFTSYFADTALSVLFNNETVTTLAVVMTEDNTATSGFIGFTFGRIKIFSDTPDDGEKGILRSYSFIAELNDTGGATASLDQTICTIQDSAA